MRGDWYTKTVLTVIALALATLAVKPLVTPSPSYAARPIEYKLTKVPNWFAHPSEDILNKLGQEGWDIAYGFGEFIVLKR